MPKQYSILIEVDEDAKWLGGTPGFYGALGGPLDNEDNMVILETATRLFARPGIAVISATKVEE